MNKTQKIVREALDLVRKEFIPYEQALALKELGFDEPCMGVYSLEGSPTPVLCRGRSFTNTDEVEYLDGDECTAPLYQQAFRWFREKYDLDGQIEKVHFLDTNKKGYMWSIFDYCSNVGEDLLNYKEAELACLQKLIEIVKNEN